MYYTCPTGQFIQQFQALLNAFCANYGLQLPETDFSQQVVVAMVEDSINDRLLWASSRTDTHIALVETLEGFWVRVHQIAHAQSRRLIHDFDHQVVCPVFYDLSRIIRQILPQRTWAVVTTRPVHDTTLIHLGDDYRIVDWERRVKSGEIPCDLTVQRHLDL